MIRSVGGAGLTLVQLKVFGLTLTRVTGVQLSLLPLFTSAGVIEAVPAAFKLTVIFFVFTTGAVLSVTTTLNVHVLEFPAQSLNV